MTTERINSWLSRCFCTVVLLDQFVNCLRSVHI